MERLLRTCCEKPGHKYEEKGRATCLIPDVEDSCRGPHLVTFLRVFVAGPGVTDSTSCYLFPPKALEELREQVRARVMWDLH